MKFRYLLIPVLLASLTGCSVTKMAGNTVVEFTHDEAIPYLMSQGDLEAACSMGQALGPVVKSFSRVGVTTENVGIATHMAAGMCAEFTQRDAELDRVRALHNNRTTDAQDALIREKFGHRLAAQRMIRGYEDAVKTFGDFSESCRKFDSKTDELLALLGLASGALAVLHDFNSEKSVGISLSVPGIIERSAACFSDDEWWGMPTALRASIWLSIPGAGPEGVDPIEAMKEAANKGDAQGVLLARAMLVMMATTVGRPEAACEALAAIPAQDTLNHDYDMLNAYAMGLMTHQADIAWIQQFGYRAPFMNPSCPAAQASTSMNAQEVDDLLDGLLDDEEEAAPAAQPQENSANNPAETPMLNEDLGEANSGDNTNKDKVTTGFLTVTTDSEALIYVDSKLVDSKTPLEKHEVNTGSHTVRVYFFDTRKFSKSRDINVEKGATMSLSFTKDE